MDEQNKGMEKAGASIFRVLEKNRILGSYKLHHIKMNWSSVMGEHIAKYSYIKDFQGSTAVIGVVNPVWMNYMFMYKDQIIKTMNEYCEKKLITDIRFVRSGKTPIPVSYETEQGLEEEFSDWNLKNIVLDTGIVSHIRKDSANLPDALREKIERLRFAQERRKAAYMAENFIQCPFCGRWIPKKEKICFLCYLKKRSAEKKKIYDILMVEPWISFKEICQQFQCNEYLYNEVRRDCIYRLIEKIRSGGDSPEDNLRLALFVTRKDPADLSEAFVCNLTEKYRRDTRVSSYRR